MSSTPSFSSPAPESQAPLPTLEQLPDDPATLKHLILELLAALRQEHHDKEQLRQRLDLLLRRLYGPRTERFDPQQPLLFAELQPPPSEDAPSQQTPAEAPPVSSQRRSRPHGRRLLPENLQRRVVHHELTEAQRRCVCGQIRVDIGTEVSEQLDWQPASLFVWQHWVHKYACPACAQPAGGQAAEQARGPAVIAAAKPAMPIDKGLPGPGLLAQVIVSKYFDHLPLYRQENIFQRQGMVLPRSTTCDWMAAAAACLRPLYERMVALVLQSRWLHTDDTRVQNLGHAPGTTDQAHLWIYWGDREHPGNVFDFTVNRRRDGPQTFLTNFKGYLHADAFSGYDALYLPPPGSGTAAIHEVACNAHARRKFYDARGSDALRAHQALAYYAQLYEIERRATANRFDDSQRRQLRQDLAVPILETFHAWLQAQRWEVLPKSPMAEAIGYALTNWSALVRYTEEGFLAIDNNVAEREMKRIAIGRKNWLFVGSDQGGHTAAVLFSFTSTCHRLGIDSWAYLQDVLSRLPRVAGEDIDELLPHRWQAARQRAADADAVPAVTSSPAARN